MISGHNSHQPIFKYRILNPHIRDIAHEPMAIAGKGLFNICKGNSQTINDFSFIIVCLCKTEMPSPIKLFFFISLKSIEESEVFGRKQLFA